MSNARITHIADVSSAENRKGVSPIVRPESPEVLAIVGSRYIDTRACIYYGYKKKGIQTKKNDKQTNVIARVSVNN